MEKRIIRACMCIMLICSIFVTSDFRVASAKGNNTFTTESISASYSVLANGSNPYCWRQADTVHRLFRNKLSPYKDDLYASWKIKPSLLKSDAQGNKYVKHLKSIQYDCSSYVTHSLVTYRGCTYRKGNKIYNYFAHILTQSKNRTTESTKPHDNYKVMQLVSSDYRAIGTYLLCNNNHRKSKSANGIETGSISTKAVQALSKRMVLVAYGDEQHIGTVRFKKGFKDKIQKGDILVYKGHVEFADETITETDLHSRFVYNGERYKVLNCGCDAALRAIEGTDKTTHHRIRWSDDEKKNVDGPILFVLRVLNDADSKYITK